MNKKSIILIAGALVLFFSRDTIFSWLAYMSNNWSKWDELFNRYGKLNGVSPSHLKAYALNESLLGMAPSVAHGLKNPQDIERSKSSDGLSWGIMQVTLKTAQDWDKTATPEKLNDPEYSIKIAALEVARNQKVFDKKDPRYWEYVVKAYNQGSGNTIKREVRQIEPQKEVVNEYFERWLRNLEKVMSGG